MVSARNIVHVMSPHTVPGLSAILKKHLPKVTFRDITGTDNLTIVDGKVDLPKECKTQLKDAEILIVDAALFSGSLVQNLPNLKWVQSTFAGVDGIINTLDKSKPYPSCTLTRLSGQLGPHMAETIVRHILTHEAKSLGVWEAQKRKEWLIIPPNRRLLRELTIGIIGVGDIGREVARLCKAGFGMTVWGLVRNLPVKSEQSPHIDVYKSTNELSTLLQNCDVICNILPSTRATINLFSGNVLETCKAKSPLFINVGRGDVISDEAVINAIRQKWISSAVLDVFVSEPLPQDNPLWTEPNVIITPHVSAVTNDKMLIDVFLDNYQRFMKNEPLKYTLRWEHGY